MRFLSLCTGIGGIDLAAEWAHMHIVGQVEINLFCRQILEMHWPDTPRYSDIREIKGDEFGAVDIIGAGIPCQPFSNSGRRRGKEDHRYLWPEVLRIIQCIWPSWILIENVAPFATMALDDLSSDLETAGYTPQAFLFPACAIGAPHRRDRTFLVAHANSLRWHNRFDYWQEGYLLLDKKWDTPTSDSDWQELQSLPGQNGSPLANLPGKRVPQPRLGREPYGFSSWLDGYPWPSLPREEPYPGELSRTKREYTRYDTMRNEVLGNAVVPAQVYPLLSSIYQCSSSL